jgi:spoIIIJ-associated protein
MSAPAERIRELLERIVAALGLPASVHVSEDDEAITGVMGGQDLGLVIGRHGQTIDALQHLAYRVALAGGMEGKRVVIDAAGYRERRAAVLRHDADEAAEDALRLGRPVALAPLGAAERRIVHEYLRDRGDVETHSEGEEPARRLVVSPLSG